MTRIGMIGGFGPESTLEYYRLLIDGYRVRKNSIDTPEILLYSMSVQKLFALVDTKKMAGTYGLVAGRHRGFA